MPPVPGQEEPIKRVDKIVTSILTRPDAAPFAEPVDWRGLELYDYPQIITKMMDLGTIKRRLERGQYATAHQVAEDVRLVWKNCMTYNAEGSDFWLLAKAYARRWEDRYRKIRQEFDVGEDMGEEEGDDDDDEEAEFGEDGDDNDDDEEFDGGKDTSQPSDRKGSSRRSKGRSSTPIDDVTPTLDERAQFGSNLFLLSGVEMGYVMRTCELECPDVLESWTTVIPPEDSEADENSNKNNLNQPPTSMAGGRELRYEANVEINVDAIPPDIFAKLSTYVTSKVGTRNLSEAASPSVDSNNRPKKKQRKSN